MLDGNLGGNKALIKELSRYGALRVGAETFMEEARQQNLANLEIWRAVIKDQEFYLATKDPKNFFYASWIYHVARDQHVELPYNNCERLGDLVETGLGVLHLATIFPEDLFSIIKDANVMWRRMETSMTYKAKWTSPPHFGTSTGQKAPLVVTANAVL